MATLTFGSCYFSTAIETVNDPGIPVKASGLTTAVLLEGFSHSDNRLTNVGVGRTYEVAFSGTISLAAGANDDVVALIGVRKNGAVTPGAWAGLNLDSAKAATYGAISCSTQVYLETGDYIEVWLTSDTGENIKLEGGTITAKVLG